jgi:hypothetical protein
VSRLLEAPPRRPPSHRPRPHYGFRRLVALLLLVSVGALVWRSGVVGSLLGSDDGTTAGKQGSAPTSSGKGSKPTTGTSAAPSSSPTSGPINTKFPGLTTFRGNATRSYYGEGPLPKHPEILWRYPASGGMCMSSNNLGATKVWCGTGWTGQPNVIQHDNGKVEIRFGAYDGHYHFLNGLTGVPMRKDIVTGDLTKGSATSDADGYPLYYGGSRDNYLRIMAVDRKKPTVLWKINSRTSVPHWVWNDDWDGAPLQIGDYLLEGGENSWFYVIRLHRHYDSAGKVQVDPRVVMLVPAYDQQLLNDLGDKNVSVENSVAFYKGVVYFGSSGGLVQGWDISDILRGGTKHKRVFRFWAGDETDASIVIDPDGYLYVGRHRSANIPNRPQTRAHAIGSLMKLDPRKPDDPVVWDRQIGGFELDGGILGTPALYKGVVWVTRTDGGFVGVSQKTGKILFQKRLPGPTWMSPVPIDDQLLVGDCNGVLHDYDITHPRQARELWTVQLSGCEESTPAVWRGMIWVGARGGAMYGIGDA